MKCGALSRTASHSHIVKPGQAHMTLNCTVVDSGEGPGGAPPNLLFLDQSDAQRAEENFLGDCTPLISRSGSGTAASRNTTIKLPSESFEEEEENNTFFASMETIGAPDEICGFESQRVMGLNPNLGLGLFPFDAKNVSFSSSSSKDSLTNLNLPSI